MEENAFSRPINIPKHTCFLKDAAVLTFAVIGSAFQSVLHVRLKLKFLKLKVSRVYYVGQLTRYDICMIVIDDQGGFIRKQAARLQKKIVNAV